MPLPLCNAAPGHPPEADGGPPVVALRRVVEHHVQQHLRGGVMEQEDNTRLVCLHAIVVTGTWGTQKAGTW